MLLRNYEKICLKLRKCAKRLESMRKCAKTWESILNAIANFDCNYPFGNITFLPLDVICAWKKNVNKKVPILRNLVPEK